MVDSGIELSATTPSCNRWPVRLSVEDLVEVTASSFVSEPM
jgi:hypothetical protein